MYRRARRDSAVDDLLNSQLIDFRELQGHEFSKFPVSFMCSDDDQPARISGKLCDVPRDLLVLVVRPHFALELKILVPGQADQRLQPRPVDLPQVVSQQAMNGAR